MCVSVSMVEWVFGTDDRMCVVAQNQSTIELYTSKLTSLSPSLSIGGDRGEGK